MPAFQRVFHRLVFALFVVQAGSWAAFPQILLQPSDVQAHAGDTAVFQLVADKVDTLKWYVNDTLRSTLPGANQKFALANVQLSQDKAKVHCVLVAADGSMRITDKATLTVLRPSRQMLTFSGELSDRFGSLVGKDGGKTIDMVVEIFRKVEGGTPDYVEVFSVEEGRGIPVLDGRFLARLGTGKATTGVLETVVQQQATLYVQFSVGKIDSREILTPRSPLTAMPYAISSAGGQIQGAGTPATLGIDAPIGTRYLDTSTSKIWLRSFKSWVLAP
ncbi:MAG: hypothetical protein IPN71_21625 [Fibrobacteres bacterium]|nr:hypothetical protein [Fibrobacterota bacterium]